MQASTALEGWESADMDDFQEASSEVDGIPPGLHLLADPSVLIHVPHTQVTSGLHLLVDLRCPSACA